MITRPLFAIPPPIVTAGGIVGKVDIENVDHIIQVTHARSFDLSCSEAMSVHARLTKLTLVYSQCNVAYTHRMRTPICLTPDRHGLPHNGELFWWCTLKGRTFLLVLSSGIILFKATVVET